MKKRIRKVMMGILLVIFVGSTAMALHQWMDNSEGDATYENAAQIALAVPEETVPAITEVVIPTEEVPEPVTYWVPAEVEDDPVMEEMAKISLTSLRAENEDVLGWIRIPGTRIDYPIMQGEDNDFYLKHTWDKQPNSVGSIFMEYLNSADFTDYNTIIYGHNMKNNSMFGDLEDYALEKFWQEHPYVYIATDSGVLRYEVFVFFRAEVGSLTYGMDLSRDDTKRDFLNLALENAWYDTGIMPELTDRILTLSTCSGGNYSNRYVVQARLPMVEITK